MYLTRKKKLGQSDKLDRIALACGEVWTDTAKWFWRTVNRQDKWLSKYTMFRWICTQKINGTSTPLGGKESRKEIAQNTAQNVVKVFFQALDSWRECRDSEGVRPPYKSKRYFKAIWNYKQIKIKESNGKRLLRLETPRGKDSILIEWSHPEPRRVEIGWDGEQYELRCQYKVKQQCEPKGDKVAGVDLGEIHIATTYVDGETIISNGRELRSKRRYQNKLKATLSSKIDRKQRGSRRWKRLVTSKNAQLAKLRNQITDILHKQSSRLVDALHERRVCKIVIGDVRTIREDLDYGKRANQKLHQWASGRFRQMLTYKAELRGMEVVLQNEAYTSQTCPACGNRHKPRGRDYNCPECNATYHRDGVGAMNIREKYLRPNAWSEGYDTAAVVADRTTATERCSPPPAEQKTSSEAARVEGVETPCTWGIKYRPHMDCGWQPDALA